LLFLSVALEGQKNSDFAGNGACINNMAGGDMEIIFALALLGFFLTGLKWPKATWFNWYLALLGAVCTVGVLTLIYLIILDSAHMNPKMIEASRPYLTWKTVIEVWLPCSVFGLGRFFGSRSDELSSND